MKIIFMSIVWIIGLLLLAVGFTAFQFLMMSLGDWVFLAWTALIVTAFCIGVVWMVRDYYRVKK